MIPALEFLHSGQARSPRPHPKGLYARQMTSHIPDTAAAGAGSSLCAEQT